MNVKLPAMALQPSDHGPSLNHVKILGLIGLIDLTITQCYYTYSLLPLLKMITIIGKSGPAS